jgi:hypothetical protein
MLTARSMRRKMYLQLGGNLRKNKGKDKEFWLLLRCFTPGIDELVYYNIESHLTCIRWITGCHTKIFRRLIVVLATSTFDLHMPGIF